MTSMDKKDLMYSMPSSDQPVARTLLDTWYHLTAPPVLPQWASLAHREAARRARLTSIVLLFLIVMLLMLLPVCLIGANMLGTIAIGGGVLVAIVALLFNRSGHLNISGLLITAYVFLSVATVILATPGGLSTEALGLFYLLVFVEVLAASLLPVNAVLPVALVNIAFVVVDLALQHKAPEFAQVLATQYLSILVRIIVLHIFVALVLWLWVRSANTAIKRADRAEELAARERQIKELQQAKLQQKEELERGIELILQTHVQISNGDFQARAPLSQDNMLWKIAHSLNTLIGRMQKYSQAAAELQYTRETVVHLTDELRQAKKTRRPVQLVTTKTFLDPLLQELASLPVNQRSFQAQPPARESDAFQVLAQRPRF